MVERQRPIVGEQLISDELFAGLLMAGNDAADDLVAVVAAANPNGNVVPDSQ
jgi:hypothetical protein